MRKKSTILISACIFIFLFILCPECFPENTANDYSLLECAEIGIKNSFKLQTYDSKVRQDDARVKHTLATNNPHVSIDGSSTYQKPTVNFGLPISLPGIPPIQGVVVPEWYHTYELAVTKLITSFGKVEAAAKVQQATVEQDRIQKDMERDTLLFQIAQAYYTLILSKEMLSIAQIQQQEWLEQQKISEALYKRGVAAKYDLLRVQVATVQAEDAVQTAGKNVDVAAGNLRTLMGLPKSMPVTDVKRVSPWSSEEEHRLEFSLDRWQDLARNNNPTLALCDLAHKQGVLALELAGLDNAPSLSFKTDYGKQTKTFVGSDWFWQNTVALSLPISDGGERKALMTEAVEMITQADLNKADTERTVLWNVEQAYLELHDLYPKIETAKFQVESATESLRVAKVRYREGLSTLIEVLDGETALRNAQLILQRTLCSYYIQMAALSYSTGIIQDDIFLLGRKP